MQDTMPNSISWLAGILEGEGCFLISGRGRGSGTPVVQLQMTDGDVVERAAALMGARVLHRSGRTPAHKDIWRANVYSDGAIDVMRAILPFMGERRAARISEILSWCEARPGIAKGDRHHNAKLRPEWIPLIRGLFRRGVRQKKLAAICGVRQPAIANAIARRTWAHIA